MLNWMIGKVFFKTIRMEIVLNGIISGIVLAFLIGPVFFTIIQTSIERGFWSGVFVAIGVSFSDALYILVSYLGLDSVYGELRVSDITWPMVVELSYCYSDFITSL